MAFFSTRTALLLSLSIAFLVDSAYTSAPTDEQNKDLRQLTSRMTIAAKRMEFFKKHTSTGPTCRCLITCQEAYHLASGDMNKGVASVEKANFNMVKHNLTSFMTEISKCDQCIGDSYKIEKCAKKLKKFDSWALRVGRDLLATTAKYSTK